jgi:hypothetical protein
MKQIARYSMMRQLPDAELEPMLPHVPNAGTRGTQIGLAYRIRCRSQCWWAHTRRSRTRSSQGTAWDTSDLGCSSTPCTDLKRSRTQWSVQQATRSESQVATESKTPSSTQDAAKLRTEDSKCDQFGSHSNVAVRTQERLHERVQSQLNVAWGGRNAARMVQLL